MCTVLFRASFGKVIGRLSRLNVFVNIYFFYVHDGQAYQSVGIHTFLGDDTFIER